jgi:hypothetical protein
LEQDISRLQREVNESFTRLLERTDAAATMSESDDALAHISAEVNAQVDQASAESVRLGADIALLRDSVAELDEQRTQAEVLNALVARAANFAPRVVLFVVKGANALAWAARGLDESANNTSIRGLSIPLQSDTVRSIHSRPFMALLTNKLRTGSSLTGSVACNRSESLLFLLRCAASPRLSSMRIQRITARTQPTSRR